MPDKEFLAIVLTEAGDFLLESEDNIERQEHGVEIEQPWIFNEEEQAQEVQAEKVFIPYTAIQNIQHGSFEQETVEN